MEGKTKLKEQLEIIEKEEKVGSSDKLAISKIVKYLLTRDDMEQKYLSEEKTLKQMWEFIRGEAKTKAVNGCAVLDDEEVYSIAVHYFDETNESLKIKNKEVKEESKTDSKVESKKQTVSDNKDEEVAMIYKGKKITFGELKSGIKFID